MNICWRYIQKRRHLAEKIQKDAQLDAALCGVVASKRVDCVFDVQPKVFALIEFAALF